MQTESHEPFPLMKSVRVFCELSICSLQYSAEDGGEIYTPDNTKVLLIILILVRKCSYVLSTIEIIELVIDFDKVTKSYCALYTHKNDQSYL